MSIQLGQPIRITDAELQAIGYFDPLSSDGSPQPYWRKRLGRAGGAYLAAQFDAHARARNEVELGERAGYFADPEHYDNVLGKCGR
jgi:hypothetical protein